MQSEGTPSDLIDTATVLDLIRNGSARTRPELARLSGLGRNVISRKIAELEDAGVLIEGSLGPSTGGRAPRQLALDTRSGLVLVAELGATSINVAACDIDGQIRFQAGEVSDITDGPDVILGRISELFKDLQARHKDSTIWGIGIGLPGPVEFTSGRPVNPPIMPGWNKANVRSFFADKFKAPVWIDNDVNLMALGELRDKNGLAYNVQNAIYVKIGTGIGAGLISRGHLHRCDQGCAGDIGHMPVSGESDVICRCGQRGCLEALAGGYALAREGTEIAQLGKSDYLADILTSRGRITGADVGRGALHGDNACAELVTQSAAYVGSVLAQLVNFFNPSLILLGGGVTQVGDLYLAAIRQQILSRSLPLATRSLLIDRSPLGNTAGLKGGAYMVLDELMSQKRLGRWLGHGTPAGHPELVND